MNIHEYQAKQILSQYGIPILSGYVASSVDEAIEAAKKLQSEVLVVKAQVHAGGRGKAGGIKLAKTTEEVKAISEKMLGMCLVTKQTGEKGKIVRKLYIEEGTHISRELYFSIILDRNSSSVMIIASNEGGIEIEEVAEHSPEKIIKVSVDPSIGLYDFHIRSLYYGLGMEKEHYNPFSNFVKAIFQAFLDKDANQIEINPLIIDNGGRFIPLDAKFNFDDNAIYRHSDIAQMYDPLEDDELEVKASSYGLSYVKMDGNIGCMVNGAGLAMATMDIIKLNGGSPANFLDVGGSATAEKVKEAFKIIIEDKSVKSILINIFGGIMRCDIIAKGVIEATKEVGVTIPVIVRLEGTNAELGKKMLLESGLDLQPAEDLEDAAFKAVKLANN